MSSRRAGNRALRAVVGSTSRKLVRTQTGKRVSEFLLIESVKISVPKNRVCRMENFIRKKKKKFFLKTEKNH
jgi:hypothetical protein